MTPANASAGSRPAKVKLHHLDRWAIDYVRQSHPQQVLRHPESALVQAQLQQRAIEWGWPKERVLVLDGDLGRSGTSTLGRDDFAWMLSEIALGHVGLILCFQLNRLAREDEACCHLIRICGVHDTLLADQDGLYHPRDFNDRMLVTMKGFMGSFELHQIQQRMQAGRLNRCRRGEWLGQTPSGYVVGPAGKLEFDPDEQARDAIRRVFDQFAILGSVSALLRYIRKHDVRVPMRLVGGPERGLLKWRIPHRESLRQMLSNPAYAGAYAWGRFAVDPRRATPARPGGGRVRRDLNEWPVFIPDNHPAYITREQYENNLRVLKSHRSPGPVPGPGRATTATLAGLVICGECGCRMQTCYSKSLRYICRRRALDYGEATCQSLAGAPLEELAGEQVLEVVAPASLELSLRAAEECERERTAADRHRRLRLERAAQEAKRAFRQYDAVEPENRLVARTLERTWEEALQAERGLKEEYDRFRAALPTRLTEAERGRIQALASDLPKLWRAETTSLEEKRRVIRLLLERVVVHAPHSTQEAKVQLHWRCGNMTEHVIVRPVSSWRRVKGASELWALVLQCRKEGWTSRRIAERLNEDGHRTPHGRLFTSASVRKLIERGGPPAAAPETEKKKRKHVSRPGAK